MAKNNIIQPHDERFTMVANKAVNSDMSLKAKGLLLVICEKSPNWQFSIEGLCAVCQEGRDAVRSAVKELKEHGFVYFEETHDEKGKFRTIWHVKSAGFSNNEVKPQVAPTTGEPTTGEPTTGEPTTANPTQLYTKEHKTEKLKTEILSPPLTPQKGEKSESPKRFQKPTIEEVQAYCDERGNGIDAGEFCDFYESKGWVVGKTKMKDWKAAIRTWERVRAKQQTPPTPREFIPIPEHKDWDI